MELYNFALSRDMLCLSGALTGISLGFFLSLAKKNLGSGSRSRRIAFALFFLSMMITSLALAFITSSGAIFYDTAVLVLTLILIPVFALTVIFPRVYAFPLVLLTGLIIVWIAYSSLRFPLFTNAPVALISSHTDGSFSINCYPGNNEESGKTYYTRANVSFLKFSVVTAEINRIFPVIGGNKHIVISEISTDADIVCREKSLEGSLLGSFVNWVYSRPGSSFLGITYFNLSGTVYPGNMAAGIDIPVFAAELTVTPE